MIPPHPDRQPGKTAPAAFLEKDDPFTKVGGVLDDMGGRNMTFGMMSFNVFTLHI
jgi:hypothetical protein